jgi:hypothetical protein
MIHCKKRIGIEPKQSCLLSTVKKEYGLNLGNVISVEWLPGKYHSSNKNTLSLVVKSQTDLKISNQVPHSQCSLRENPKFLPNFSW